MATKKVKRYNGEDESMVDQDAADQEATSMMKRGMAEDDSKALPAGYKVEPEAPAKSAPVMRKPKPNFSNEGRSSKAPAPSTPARKVETTNVPKAIADFFRPKSAAEKDSANRAALRESEKPKPKAQMGLRNATLAETTLQVVQSPLLGVPTVLLPKAKLVERFVNHG